MLDTWCVLSSVKLWTSITAVGGSTCTYTYIITPNEGDWSSGGGIDSSNGTWYMNGLPGPGCCCDSAGMTVFLVIDYPPRKSLCNKRHC